MLNDLGTLKVGNKGAQKVGAIWRSKTGVGYLVSGHALFGVFLIIQKGVLTRIWRSSIKSPNSLSITVLLMPQATGCSIRMANQPDRQPRKYLQIKDQLIPMDTTNDKLDFRL